MRFSSTDRSQQGGKYATEKLGSSRYNNGWLWVLSLLEGSLSRICGLGKENASVEAYRGLDIENPSVLSIA